MGLKHTFTKRGNSSLTIITMRHQTKNTSPLHAKMFHLLKRHVRQRMLGGTKLEKRVDLRHGIKRDESA